MHLKQHHALEMDLKILTDCHQTLIMTGKTPTAPMEMAIELKLIMLTMTDSTWLLHYLTEVLLQN